jgi:hypothetical protein
MQSLVEYINQCIRPVNSTEFYEGVFDETVFNSLRQDGIMITSNYKSQNAFVEHVYLGNNTHIIKKVFKPLEWLNEDDTQCWVSSDAPLYQRLMPPPLETVNHPFIITSIINNNNPRDKTYIEYGVRDGTTLMTVAPYVKKTYGVDLVQSPRIPPNCDFYVCYTDSFSTNVLPNITYHFAFIDADHKFESVVKDFEALYRYIQPGGYIFLHDTYPCIPVLLDPGYCNDCYKAPIEIKKLYPSAEILTLPLNPGVTIVRKP